MIVYDPNVADCAFADLVCRILSSLPISSLASVRRRLGPLILADIVGVRGSDIPMVQKYLKFSVDVAPSFRGSFTHIFLFAISVASLLFVGQSKVVCASKRCDPLRHLNFVQLLNFFKMSFSLFSVCSVFAVIALMPVNLKVSNPSLQSCVHF